jgi:hypothetical protein
MAFPGRVMNPMSDSQKTCTCRHGLDVGAPGEPFLVSEVDDKTDDDQEQENSHSPGESQHPGAKAFCPSQLL